MSNERTYYDKEIDALCLEQEYPGKSYRPTIKIYAPSGESTKHFSITREQVEKIRAILNEGAE